MAEKECKKYPQAICPIFESTNVIPFDESGTKLICKKCGYEADIPVYQLACDESYNSPLTNLLLSFLVAGEGG
jgi:hypothetical protein